MGEWFAAHPWISGTLSVIWIAVMIGGLITAIFPRTKPVLENFAERVFAILAGGVALLGAGFALFFWIIPGIEERLSTPSGQAYAIIGGLVMIICLLVAILATLKQILGALERDR